MAHYAYLDENNIVTQVIVGKDENEDGIDWEEYYGAKRTSYNTRAGIHYDPNTNEPSADQTKAYRKNYAGIGFAFDEERDAFIPIKTFDSWILNEETCDWEAPIPRPEEGLWGWNEELGNWEEIVLEDE